MIPSLITLLQNKHWTLAVAESCTGGLLAKQLTDFPGSSAWFDLGCVTYSNEAKMRVLGVSKATLEQTGAVSEATAFEMAAGVLRLSGADLAVAITGIAGPEGGSPEKPVGRVCFAYGRPGALKTTTRQFSGDRAAIREAAAAWAVELLLLP